MVFDSIVMFTQLVETGNFSKTAEHFKISTATLTRKMQELEAYFNKLLMIRDTRNICLTSDGELVYHNFKHLRATLTDCYRKINPEQHADLARVSVVLPVFVSLNFITPYLNHFLLQYPEIKLNLFYQNHLPDLCNNDIDLAIMSQSVDNDKYTSQFLRTEYIGLFCSIDYARKYGVPLITDDLSEHSVIGGIEADDKILEHLVITNRYTNDSHVYNSSNDAVRINNLAHALKIGLCGEHIFGCWNYMCEEYINNGQVIPVLPEYYVYRLDLHLISRKLIRPEEQLFIDFIRRCMNRTIQLDIISDNIGSKISSF